ncbi:hypothetical protein KIN20_000542 [Parelaphostrongylus tenuis]|uniref:Uncharacterized protein n=1 Tax=Parelaphostrongylus tenuis TaxID=148309 RepID=A0AAD5MBF2_PARTN|nr:hypothetical protein KIN20_000542 [Parelaphostrongylus tenuis]
MAGKWHCGKNFRATAPRVHYVDRGSRGQRIVPAPLSHPITSEKKVCTALEPPELALSNGYLKFKNRALPWRNTLM